MTRNEALKILDTIPTIGEQADALEMAIRSLEALDEVHDYLESRIDETNQDMEEDSENREWYLGYWQGLTEAKVVITHLKEVEE